MTDPITYAGSGVDYGPLDSFKRLAQQVALGSGQALERRFGFREVAESRGESVHLMETPWGFLAHLAEGLGTKILVADEMARLTGFCYYSSIGQDAFLTIVNDLVTSGAHPISVAMHIAVADAEWFRNENRTRALIFGWYGACLAADCAWGGGETAILCDVVVPGAAVLSGSAHGIIMPKERRIKGNVVAGDAIVLVASSGIHANGITLAREIAARLPKGYLTELSDGSTYGHALLTPTRSYVPLIAACGDANTPIHYAAHITGHGWRKLMRLPQPFAYVIERLPDPFPIFDFIKEQSGADDREMYGTFNMGAGFALYVPQSDAVRVVSVAEQHGYRAFVAGRIESVPERKVVIKPKGIEFDAASLQVR